MVFNIQLVDSDHYIPCLNEICQVCLNAQQLLNLPNDCCKFIQTMWKVMYNYHQIKYWHGARDCDVEKSSENNSDAEDSFSRHYVKTKLENGLLRVWRVSS